jgi:hypothetical protein
VTVQQLPLGPGLQIEYAVTGGLVIPSTSLDALAGVLHHTRSLEREAVYQRAVGGPQRATSLRFLDFSQLLRLADQAGLTRSARYQALKPDLERIRAIGLHVARGEAESTAELFLQIP